METFGGAERDKLRIPPHVTLDTLDGHSLPFVWFFSLKAFLVSPLLPKFPLYWIFVSVVELLLSLLPSPCRHFFFFLYTLFQAFKKNKHNKKKSFTISWMWRFCFLFWVFDFTRKIQFCFF